jgi:hypothetical protein
MNIKETIAEISRAKWMLEMALEENGGELTPELLEQADTLEDMKELLAGEGIDELGRWLKSVQDEIATRKAEADAAARRLKNLKSYEDYVKGLIGQALDAIGAEKVKGSFYGFKRTTSTRSSVDQEALDAKYLERAETALRHALIPEYVHVSLKATTTELREAGALEFVDEVSAPALSFTKPRKAKDE